jgi:hypothetical protein
VAPHGGSDRREDDRLAHGSSLALGLTIPVHERLAAQ